MATTKVTTETKPIEFNGAKQQPAERPPPVSVVVDTESGVTMAPATGGKGTISRIEALARAKARIAERAGKTGGATAVETPAPGAAETAAAGGEPHGEPEATDDAVGSGTPGTDAHVEPEPTATEEPATPAAQPADKKPTPTSPDAAELQARYEQVLAERDRLRSGDLEQARARRDAELDAIGEDPVSWLREQVADRVGGKADAPEVGEILGWLAEELTWGQVPAQDLPEPRKAQLETARTRRTLRLQQHRRKADQGARQSEELERRVRTQAQRVLEAKAKEHPFLALAEELDGVRAADALVGFLVRGAKAGVIKTDEVTEDAAWQEAARLGNAHFNQRALRLYNLLKAHFAPQAPAAAPDKPGAAKPNGKAGTQQQPAATPKGSPASPSAMSPTKANAAPSRPAEQKPDLPKKRVIDMSAPFDPDEDRARVLSRWKRD